MTASDYQINFPYGVTSSPYSVAHPHRGDDRPCLEGTPVVINGTQLGLTGATGFVSGPHLHIQEWNGDYSNTRKPQNAFQPGIVVNIDPNGTQGDGTFGKFVTVKTADGWCDSYCHLSQIDVQIGQEVGEDMAQIEELTGIASARHDQLNDLWLACGVDPGKVTDERQATAQAIANVDAKNKQIEQLSKSPDSEVLTTEKESNSLLKKLLSIFNIK